MSRSFARNYVEHDFYCINCGKKSLPVRRNKGHQQERLHRKKLYCPWCKTEVNHIECKTYDDVEEFKTNFLNGVYKDEAEESLAYVRNTRLG